ncbi:COG3904 family protein [Ensifer soli]|uniref:COG3904 family protein n=1 Tax=Ciceribacter sp. sgz301302 TaxID=3342379 RepID=UPI0035B88F8C
MLSRPTVDGWKSRVLALDDGALMRAAFLILLAAAGVFLVIDLREIGASNAARPGASATPSDIPILPPVLTGGEPDDPPSEILTDAETLQKPITFELLAGGILSARGAIDPGAAARFRSEIEARGEYVTTVALDSPGGSVEDALDMSTLIRERKLSTSVAGGALCASSCPLVLAGGVTRTAADGAVVGVHQVFNGSADRPSPEEAMATGQRLAARISRHLDAMGVKPGLWLHALETPPDRLYYLDGKEMRALALTTPAAAETASAKKRK